MSLHEKSEVVFDALSTDSPRLSSPDIAIEIPINAEGDLNEEEEKLLRQHSAELEGMRTVALTPVEEHAPIPEPASPPLVLKSVPTTPIVPTHRTSMEQPFHVSDADTQISLLSLADPKKMQTDHSDDEDDPRALVIASLRTQISDLFSQVSLLNTKLVQSYDRVSQLEETLDENNEKLRALDGERINLEREKDVLERERIKHEEMLRDGQLVERKAVAEEMSRLMEESIAATNAKQTAEAKKSQIEAELSDLSANLFTAANDMVVKERQMRSSVEDALAASVSSRTALEAQVNDYQKRLMDGDKTVEALKEERGLREVEMNELRKAVKSMNSVNISSQGSGVIRMMNSHLPFKGDYLSFISHLRTLFPTTPNPPNLSSLLTLPFVQRLAIEDSEPTLRLDLAPSLNWLTRRSVLAAIHASTLRIEQIHVATLFLENSASTYSYSSFGSGTSLPTSPTQLTKVTCALCGKTVYMSPEAIQAEEQHYQSQVLSQSPTTPTPTATQQPTLPSRIRTDSGGGWAAASFLKGVNLPSLGGSGNNSGTNTPVRRRSLNTTNANPPVSVYPLDRPPSPPPPTSLQTLIHSFRVPLANKGNAPAESDEVTDNYGPPYPLCHSGWCVSRLRTTCELWSFVKSGIVERVWQEARSINLKDHIEVDGETHTLAINGKLDTPIEPQVAPSPVLPVKKKMANLWDMGRGAFDKAMRTNSPSTSSPSSDNSLFSSMRRTLSGTSAPTSAPTAAPTSPPKQEFTSKERTRDSREERRLSLSEKLRVSTDETKPSMQLTETQPPPLPKRSYARPSNVADADAALHDMRVNENHVHADDGAKADEAASDGPGGAPSTEKPLLSSDIEPPKKEDTTSTDLSTAHRDPLLSNQDLDAREQLELVIPTPLSTGFPESTKVDDEKDVGGLQPTQGANDLRNPESQPTGSIQLQGSMDSVPESTPHQPVAANEETPVRPSTPVKPTGVPPPLPRRAAARNAARGSMVHLRKVSTTEERSTPVAEPSLEKTEPDAKQESAAPIGSVAAEEPVEDTSGADIVDRNAGLSQTSALQTEDADKTLTEVLLPDSVQAAIQPADDGDAEVPTPKSVSMPLPPPEMPSPSQHPIPDLPLLVTKESTDSPGATRPRQASVVSSSSAYSQSVYTTNSAIPTGEEAVPPPVPDKTHSSNHIVQMFYVGRSTWEERAWLELVSIRENMFWARLGGVRH
ncbi:hypothetical protein FRC18_006103 [Serendipita sp. 400]|nr:hypothetical protein FRC18_006103 [Serendipita sp. 400]